MSAYDGKECIVSFCIAPESAVVAWDSWTHLGMMRAKSLKIAWDTAKSTADGTTGAAQTLLATRCSTSFSGDGVSDDAAIHHQRLLKKHFHNPGAVTRHQPKVWFRLDFGAGDVFTGPFLLTSFGDDAQEAETNGWSLEAVGNGKTVYGDDMISAWAKTLDAAVTGVMQ